MMNYYISYLLFASCASNEPLNPDFGAKESTSDLPRGSTLTVDITQSTSELAAVKAQKDFLSEMATQGIYPEKTPTQVTVKYHRSGVTVGLYNEAYVTQSLFLITL